MCPREYVFSLRGQAAPLERAGIVPRCSWHGHCSEAKAEVDVSAGRARLVSPATGCKHPKLAIVPNVTTLPRLEATDPRPDTEVSENIICGGPKLRTWQWVR